MFLYPLDKMSGLFDVVSTSCFHVIAPPTRASIRKINEHFGVPLPPSMVDFVQSVQCYGSLFAGLGEDYNNQMHIIKINSQYRKMRRRKHGDKWRRALPREFIVINHGHDDDCNCIDTGDWNAASGEYRLTYWCPGLEQFDHKDDSFLHYINRQLMYRAKHYAKYRNYSDRNRDVYEKITRILGEGWEARLRT